MIRNLRKLISENRQQAEQLHKETNEIVAQEQLPEELGEALGMYMERVTKQFDDPRLQSDPSVRIKRAELQKHAQTMLETFKQYEQFDARITEEQNKVRERDRAAAEKAEKGG